MRPIGIDGVLRWIIRKAVMKIFKNVVQNASDPTQLRVGQQAGCEPAVHSVVDTYEQDVDCGGVVQIDATNAFNSLNRKMLLHNIKIICPEISNYVNNTYAIPSRLFLLGGEEIISQEGTTQGDPVYMLLECCHFYRESNQKQNHINMHCKRLLLLMI